MMALPDELLSAIGPIIESVSHDASRRYRQFGADHEDFQQECLLWCYDHPKKLIEWFDPDLTEPRAGERLLARSLRNNAIDVGEELKAQHLGYSRDDLSFYSRAMVRELLPSMFDEEAWLHPEQNDGEKVSGGDPATGNNWVATLADLSRAFDQLDSSDRDLLRRFHQDGDSNNDVAADCGVPKQTMSDWHDRAVRRLVDILGGAKPRAEHDADCEHPYRGGWVGRRSASNAQARAVQQSYWDED